MESSEGIFHVLRRNIPTGGKVCIVYRWYVEIFPYIKTVGRHIHNEVAIWKKNLFSVRQL